MFEQSLVVSQQAGVSREERWTAFASLFVQVAVVGALIALPLMHPERLGSRVDAPHVTLPSLKMPKPVVVQQVVSSAAASMALPRLGASTLAPKIIPTGIDMRANPEPAIVSVGSGMRTGMPDGVSLVGAGSDVHVVAASSAVTKKVRVSEGVSAGMLLTPMRPVYPSIAKAAGVQGVVVVEATISKAGRIESLRVVSGPEILRPAAIEAIQSARYRPYRLNGEPTEVQTTITMNFTMNS